MLQWFHRLMPAEHSFFPLFKRHAATLVSGATALRLMLNGGDEVGRRCADVMRREQEADDITREILLAVRTSFITPFDRGDIKNLITSMDDAIDQMQKTAKAIVLFDITVFEPEMRLMADAIVECAKLVERAVPLLSRMSQNAGQLSEICLQITKIEGEGDEVHERGLKALYVRSQSGTAMEFIRGNEIYDHLEKVIDRFDDVANQVQGIVIEHV
jgi:uncharacterized protein